MIILTHNLYTIVINDQSRSKKNKVMKPKIEI